MNTTETLETTSDESSESPLGRWRRIDPGHENGLEPLAIASTPSLVPALTVAGDTMLEVEEPTPEMVAAVAGESLDARREQLQLQVSQLAGHLQERLREVDRRESALNARVAQLESDLRTSRMWLREREIAFQEREAELK